MKTIKQKNRKQIEKAVFKSFISILIIVAVGITVNGQNFWASAADSFKEAEKSEMNENAGNGNMSYSTGEVAKWSQIESEKSLKLEEWMVTDNYFGTFVNVETENEEPLELESWMTNDSFFEVRSELTAVEKENALELEAWMTNDNYFTVLVFSISEEADDKLEIENWMVDAGCFEIISAGNNEKVDQTTAKIAGRF